MLFVTYVVAYVVLDSISYIQPVLKLGITPWNPQAGLTLAVLILFGPVWSVGTALAALLAEVLTRDTPASPIVLVGASVWIALGYAGLSLFLRHWGLRRHLETPTATVRFVVAVATATLVVAAGYVGLFLASNTLPEKVAATSVARYWVGDLNGILTLTPLLLLLDSWRVAWRTVRRHILLIAAQAGTVVLVMWVIFGTTVTDEVRFFYLLFVPVIWIGLRWGIPGAALSTLTVQVGLILAVHDQPDARLLVDLQFLLLTLSVTALLLGAVVTERADTLMRIALRESEQRALLATAPDGVITVDPEGQIRSANPAALRLFGNRIIGRTRALQEILPTARLNTAEDRANTEGLRTDGSVFPAEIAWARLEAPANGDYLVIIRDATDRRRAELQLRERETALSRAMRFAVAGELASSLAHELNQPITALVSYLQASGILAASLISRDERLQETLKKATQEALRAAQVLRRLRDFYRGAPTKREELRVSAVCTTVLNSFEERLQRHQVKLRFEASEALPGVHADATQIEIVLHNLLANAIDAVSEQPAASRYIDMTVERSADQLVVSVEDSGPGVAAELVPKLFEPFMTSKVDGMGLGLAISRSLITGQAGELVYEPRMPGAGARFVIRLPFAAARREGKPVSEATTEESK
jgi:PAS domain S-box-containing protein